MHLTLQLHNTHHANNTHINFDRSCNLLCLPSEEVVHMKFVYGKDVPIHMVDNWVKPHEHENILMYCEQAKYTYGEKDDENVAPTGMSAEIRAHELIYRFLFEMTQPLSLIHI